MSAKNVVVVLSALIATALSAIQVEITAKQPKGIQFSVPDAGYSMVGLHYSINKPLAGVAAGDYNVDVRTKSGNNFVYEDTSVTLNPGDKVNYWVLTIATSGEGVQLLDQSFTYSGAATTAATAKPTTAAHVTTKQPAATLATILATTTKPHNNIPSLGDNTGNAGTVHTGSLGSLGDSENTHTGTNTNTNTGSVTQPQNTASGGGTTIMLTTDPYNKESTCTSYPCLVFEDNFDKLDTKLWEHEITAGGGGNWEFQYYTNNRSNAYAKDGKLFIKPTLTTDRFGPDFLEHGTLNLWGANPTDTCTGPQFWGCERTGMPGQVLNPIQSARLRSSRYFNFKYGRMEVEAKMPTGDWLWPAIWLLPRWNTYGIWPASGEIDIVESRGNLHYKDDKGQPAGLESMGSTLHFGPFVEANQWPKAHASTTAESGTFADSFHKYQLDWDDQSIRFTVDGKEILNVKPSDGGFWEFGDFEATGKSKWDNPWSAGGHMAPFDQEFYIIMNVAVGGVGFFPDNFVNSPYPKPWNDHAGHAATAFWNARNNWLPTWNLDKDNGEGAAMQVNYIKVWKMGPTPP